MKNEKQPSRAFDKVIENLRKLNGKKVASYLLGYLDGAAFRDESRPRVKNRYYFPDDFRACGRRK